MRKETPAGADVVAGFARCNSLPCRPGITRRCNTLLLSLLMNNRAGEIVRDARTLRCEDLRLDLRYEILFRSHRRHDAPR